MGGVRRGRVARAGGRRAAALLGLGLLGGLIWAGADLVYVLRDRATDYAAPADVILVLGCRAYDGNVPGPVFSAGVRRRAHHAAALYRRGLAASVITTGGRTGPGPSEAAALAAVLEAGGVPATAILLEEQAQDTVQNIRFSRILMQTHGWRTALLVTEPSHIKRAALIARDGGLTVYRSPAVATRQKPDARRIKLLRNAQALMIYQIRRLRGEQI
jgi:uncharacterized SAM-binding protein YcdF (DUF218 family)